jgi:hypothetical protein
VIASNIKTKILETEISLSLRIEDEQLPVKSEDQPILPTEFSNFLTEHVELENNVEKNVNLLIDQNPTSARESIRRVKLASTVVIRYGLDRCSFSSMFDFNLFLILDPVETHQKEKTKFLMSWTTNASSVI